MIIQLIDENGGKLAKADYEHFVPEFERLVMQHGKLRLLFDMTGFHRWKASTAWRCSASRSPKRRFDTSSRWMPPRHGSGWTRRNGFGRK